MNLVKQKSSHWYQFANGECTPCYELPKKSGPGIKKPTLREAKELGLYPSITTILDVLAKPALTNWLISQGILSALTLPRLPDEPDDKFAGRVVEDMGTQGQEAADFGTEIHDHIEKYVSEGVIDMESKAEPFTRGTRDWVNQEVEQIIATEHTVYCPALCLAGRLDLLCRMRSNKRLAVVDFKSQEVKRKPNGEAAPAFYDEYPLQCAGYGELVRRMRNEEQAPLLISIIINRAEAEKPYVRIWDETPRYMELFMHAFELWCYLRGYDPRSFSKD